MERLLAIGAPSLERETADGSTLRVTLALFDALRVLCPFTEAVRPGLFVLPTRGPSRFFGGEDNVLSAVADIVTDATGESPQLGVADGLFCAELAARAGVVVAPGGTDQFRARQPVEVLGSRDLAQTAHRLGLHTVGDFAALPPGRVAERFDRAVRHRHLVARGEVATLEGQRDPTWEARLTRLREGRESPDEQLGFFGQRGAGDLRAEAAARRVRHRLGAAGIVVASVGEGRAPADRGRLVPWGSPAPVAATAICRATSTSSAASPSSRASTSRSSERTTTGASRSSTTRACAPRCCGRGRVSATPGGRRICEPPPNR